MKRGWGFALVPGVVVLLALSAQGDETRKSEVDALRGEVARLNARVEQLTQQLRVMNERLVRLEALASAKPGAAPQEPAETVEPKVRVPEKLERGSQMDPIQQERRLRLKESLRPRPSVPSGVPEGKP